MTKEQQERIQELLSNNAEAFTPRMMSDIFWCVKHEEEIRKMMGLTPCVLEERYRIQYLFLTEGQTSLYFAMQYHSLYGKTEEEIAEEKERIKSFLEKQSKNQVPYDYDLEFKYQEESFLEWCDDHDCAALVRKNKDDDLLRLSYIAMAIGYKELAAYICACINPSSLTNGEEEEDKAALERLEEKWIYEFIEKQPEGDRKEELKKSIETNWPRLREARRDCGE